VWTMFDGVAYYHCELQCDGFMQQDLFEEVHDGVLLTVARKCVTLDRSGSVSAYEERERC